jgi:hypothetical protein
MCLATAAAVNNALALRLCAADEGDILGHNNTGMAYHTTITMDEYSDKVSGGAACRLLPIAGTTGAAAFALTSNREWATMTVVILPDDGV